MIMRRGRNEWRLYEIISDFEDAMTSPLRGSDGILTRPHTHASSVSCGVVNDHRRSAAHDGIFGRTPTLAADGADGIIRTGRRDGNVAIDVIDREEMANRSFFWENSIKLIILHGKHI